MRYHESKRYLLLAIALLWTFPGESLAQVPPGASTDAGLKSGDSVEILVWQRPELSGQFTVAVDGTLVHPLYRQVRVTGLTGPEVEERMRSFLSEYEANPLVVVRPLYRVSIAGFVLHPNIYDLPAGTTLNGAVTEAGGVTERGKMDDVRIVRGANEFEVDLRAPATVNMLVQSGDQILVQERASIGAFRTTVLPLISLGISIAHIFQLANR